MYLVALVVVPFIFSLLSLISPGTVSRWVALVGSLLQLILTLIILFFVCPCSDLTLDVPWVTSLGIRFSISLKPLGLVLVLLTNIVVPVVISSSAFQKPFSENSLFYFLVLLMQTALVGVFTATDAFLFYVCWEAALIPIYFISAIWGGSDKIRITFKFFIYTIFGSLLMLAAIIYLYTKTPAPHGFSLDLFLSADLSSLEEFWVFLAFFTAFAIKIPIFPLHTWQPDTYTESPTAATMLLSGIMLKMGIYGVMLWLIPIAPFAFADNSAWIGWLCVIGIVYASVIALMQNDVKRMVAYASIAHVGLIAAGVFTGTTEGMQGATIQMFNHGINVIALFYIFEIISQRTGTRKMDELGGIASKAPILTLLFLIVVLGTIALPLTNGFPGEFLLLLSVYKFHPVLGIMAGLTIIFGAVYMLRMFKKVMLGKESALTQSFQDIKSDELSVLVPLVAIILFLGIFPNSILQITDTFSSETIQYLKENSYSNILGAIKKF